MAKIPGKLADALRRSQHALILTGSGISAESGIPTFRDPQEGLWAKFRPEELATPEAFARDPALVWQWYQWRRELIARARPNPGHLAIAALERLMPQLTLVTQNVDGLHQQAGSMRVIEFHGNISRNRCSVENCLVNVDTAGTTKPPRCPNCDAPVRPDVIWFGEAIPNHLTMAARLAAADCDLCLSVGTSAIVQPAAGLIDLARQSGALLVEINPERTSISTHADFMLQGTAGQLLPALVNALA